ncbi:MAG: ATP synthase F1 subunit epsilon [Muribaculaceae bacterium]|nr:ATP synthase F1 subunit epsilon [Muribaculaceae bacterium]
MTLKIISAVEIVFEGQVQSVTLPGSKGNFTVLNNHASLISTLTKGRLTYRQSESGSESTVEISGGLADIDNNVISVCIY